LTDQFPNSRLSTMFSQVQPHMRTGEGSIFLDRNFKVFSYVIDYLRNKGKVPKFENAVLKEQFMQELKFWDMLPDSLITSSLLEKDPSLQKVVNLVTSAPDLSGKALMVFNKLGPLDLGVLIEEGKVSYDSSLAFKINKKVEGLEVTYSGQVDKEGRPHGIGRWTLNKVDDIYEG